MGAEIVERRVRAQSPPRDTREPSSASLSAENRPPDRLEAEGLKPDRLDRSKNAPARLADNAPAPSDRLHAGLQPPLTLTRRRELAPRAVTAIVDASLGAATKEALNREAHAIAKSQEPDGSWMPEDGESVIDASVMHHLATISLLRSELLTPEARLGLEATLAASWVNLTGAFRAPEKMMDRLPWGRTMRRTEKAVGAMQNAVFSGKRDDLYSALRAVNRAPDARTLNNVVLALNVMLSKCRDDYEFLNKLNSLVGNVLHDTGKPAAQFAAGLIASYALVSLMESRSHDKTHHQSAEQLAEWRKTGRLAEMLKASYLRHGDVVNPHISWNDIYRSFAPASPAYAAMVAGAITVGVHPLTYAGIVAPALVVPLAAKILHPYLHMTRSETEEKAGPVMRWFLDTRAGRQIARQHFVHHAREEDVNYNLLPGADVMFGKRRDANDEELAIMRELDLHH